MLAKDIDVNKLTIGDLILICEPDTKRPEGLIISVFDRLRTDKQGEGFPICCDEFEYFSSATSIIFPYDKLPKILPFEIYTDNRVLIYNVESGSKMFVGASNISAAFVRMPGYEGYGNLFL